MIEAGAMVGLSPRQTCRVTLPELMLLMRGWQRAHGLEPGAQEHSAPMTRVRLMELIEKETNV